MDSFITRRLATEGLKLQNAAPPEQICRRLHLDLIGLPPSPGEVDAFVREAQRGFGVGKALFRRMARRLASDGCRHRGGYGITRPATDGHAISGVF